MPSVINELLLQEVKVVIESGSSVLLVDPVGLKADESLKLRKDLNDVGATLKVAKAKLVKRVMPEDAQEQISGKGSLGVVAGEDIGAAAKIVRDLVKEDRVSVKGAMIEGQALDAGSALKLADLPSREQLHGMLVNVLAAPMTNLARVINEVPTSLVRVLNAVKDSKGDD